MLRWNKSLEQLQRLHTAKNEHAHLILLLISNYNDINSTKGGTIQEIDIELRQYQYERTVPKRRSISSYDSTTVISYIDSMKSGVEYVIGTTVRRQYQRGD